MEENVKKFLTNIQQNQIWLYRKVATLSHFQVAKSYISESLLNRPYQINVNMKCVIEY